MMRMEMMRRMTAREFVGWLEFYHLEAMTEEARQETAALAARASAQARGR